MYTKEQKDELYRILGGHQYVYHIKVFHLIAVGEDILCIMLEGSYKLPILTAARYSDENDFYREIAMIQRFRKLNAIINIVKLENIPLYINTVPEIAQWRLLINQ
jgi:hypothetical protein